MILARPAPRFPCGQCPTSCSRMLLPGARHSDLAQALRARPGLRVVFSPCHLALLHIAHPDQSQADRGYASIGEAGPGQNRSRPHRGPTPGPHGRLSLRGKHALLQASAMRRCGKSERECWSAKGQDDRQRGRLERYDRHIPRLPMQTDRPRQLPSPRSWISPSVDRGGARITHNLTGIIAKKGQTDHSTSGIQAFGALAFASPPLSIDQGLHAHDAAVTQGWNTHCAALSRRLASTIGYLFLLSIARTLTLLLDTPSPRARIPPPPCHHQGRWAGHKRPRFARTHAAPS